MGAAETLTGWEMRAAGEPLAPAVRPLRALKPGEAMVRIAGCGLCHTDIGYLFEGVPTRRPPPLILGHEISGIVEDAGSGARSRIGEAVVVPAVLPCGWCALCRAGRGVICRSQVMPGNDCDGGFADRVILPARGLCRVPGGGSAFDAPLGNASGLTLRHLAVVADAVSTAWMAVKRAAIQPGDLVVIVGLGGVGTYAAQFAAAAGGVVAGVDVDPLRLAGAAALGCSLGLDPRSLPPKELRARLRDHGKRQGCPDSEWKLFECSGTPAGQTTAWGLLNHGATLMVVGYTADALTLRLSNLMAFDARALGNWGCPPEEYPALLDLVLDGRVHVAEHVELRPLAGLPAAIGEVHDRKVRRRLVFCPESRD